MSQTAEEREARLRECRPEIIFRKRDLHSHCFTLAKKEQSHASHSAQARPTMHCICLVIIIKSHGVKRVSIEMIAGTTPPCAILCYTLMAASYVRPRQDKATSLL